MSLVNKVQNDGLDGVNITFFGQVSLFHTLILTVGGILYYGLPNGIGLGWDKPIFNIRFKGTFQLKHDTVSDEALNRYWSKLR